VLEIENRARQKIKQKRNWGVGGTKLTFESQEKNGEGSLGPDPVGT